MSDREEFRFVFASMWFGGTNVAFRNLRDAVSARADIDASWVQIEPEPEEFMSRIPPISLNWTLKGGVVARSRIRMLENAGQPFDAAYFNDHITASFSHVGRKHIPSVIALDITPLLMNKYGKWYNVPSSSGKGLLERLKFLHTRSTYKRATFLLPWTKWVKDSLLEDYGVDEQKVIVQPPGIDLKKWHCEGFSCAEHLSKVRVLLVGREFRRKGGDLVCQIAKDPAFQDCEFHFVTNSNIGEQGSNIFVHKDLQPNSKQLIDLFRKCDIFVMPTHADFFPLAILEAMSMRMPVISTDVGGISEMVDDGNTGFLIRQNDKHALSDRLTRLIRSPELRTDMGVRARKTAELKFDLERNAEVVMDLIYRAARSKKIA